VECEHTKALHARGMCEWVFNIQILNLLYFPGPATVAFSNCQSDKQSANVRRLKSRH
jgi:hypothetical protein